MKQSTLVLAVLALAACARPVAPEGGPKDTTPPGVVVDKSTPNNTTRFAARTFQLTFDEWVTLQEVGSQVLVSPPLAKRPEVTLKGHTVHFKLDKEEVLRPNTTYTVNFGAAVKDLHEGNPAQDLRFVFSTGDFIDSLSVTGIVVDAFSGEPVENISVLLYDNMEDSVVRKERPYYFSRTDKSGQFSIQNVRAGIFRCVAIEDADQNLKWTEAERIGFLDSALVVGDSLRSTPAFRLFSPKPAMRLLAPNAGQYGLIRLGFTRSPDSIALRPELPGLRWLREQEQDTLLVWYDHPDSTAWKLYAGQDTISVRALSRSAFLQQNRLFFGDERVAKTGDGKSRGRLSPAPELPVARVLPPPRTINVRPGKPVRIPFSAPVTRVDTSLCLLLADSVVVRAFALTADSSSPRVLGLDLDWQSERRYTLTLLPGALTDFWGIPNADTLRRFFVTPSEKQVGTLRLTIENLQPGTPCILRLMNGNTAEEERFFTPETATALFVFSSLAPLAYSVQLVVDTNGNRRWDTGDYFARQQPERVFLKKLDPLRANWEVEVSMQAKADTGKRSE
ncbi:MAG: Ig-like domain-containing protein [Lewinellaceae bacterium]|nr:Ig-like domain-containing protein [Lewinellaceae bacterium]